MPIKSSEITPSTKASRLKAHTRGGEQILDNTTPTTIQDQSQTFPHPSIGPRKTHCALSTYSRYMYTEKYYKNKKQF